MTLPAAAPNLHDRIKAVVEEHRDAILGVSHAIHAQPEVAFEEHRVAAPVADVVEAHGYTVERGVGRLPTAVRGTLAGGLGEDGPCIVVLAEYDALPGLGHGCGHNTMAASGVGAAIARPETRVHGIITDGGSAANMIPAATASWFMIRAADKTTFGQMRTQLSDLEAGAAWAADCEGSVVFSGRSTSMRNNEVLVCLWSADLVAAGVSDGHPVPELARSSDMGRVSLAMPAIHPCLVTCDAGVAGHSIEFRDAAALPRADEVTLLAATLVAQTASDLLQDPSLVAAPWQEHRGG